MNISVQNGLNKFSNYFDNFNKNGFISSITVKHKIIFAVAAYAIGFLVVCLYIRAKGKISTNEKEKNSPPQIETPARKEKLAEPSENEKPGANVNQTRMQERTVPVVSRVLNSKTEPRSIQTKEEGVNADLIKRQAAAERKAIIERAKMKAEKIEADAQTLKEKAETEAKRKKGQADAYAKTVKDKAEANAQTTISQAEAKAQLIKDQARSILKEAYAKADRMLEKAKLESAKKETKENKTSDKDKDDLINKLAIKIIHANQYPDPSKTILDFETFYYSDKKDIIISKKDSDIVSNLIEELLEADKKNQTFFAVQDEKIVGVLSGTLDIKHPNFWVTHLTFKEDLISSKEAITKLMLKAMEHAKKFKKERIIFDIKDNKSVILEEKKLKKIFEFFESFKCADIDYQTWENGDKSHRIMLTMPKNLDSLKVLNTMGIDNK